MSTGDPPRWQNYGAWLGYFQMGDENLTLRERQLIGMLQIAANGSDMLPPVVYDGGEMLPVPLCADCRHSHLSSPNMYCRHPRLSLKHGEGDAHLSFDAARTVGHCGAEGRLYEANEDISAEDFFA